MPKSILLAALAVVVLSVPARADVTARYKHTETGGKPEFHTMQLAPGKLAMTIEGKQAGRVIYRAKDDVIIWVDEEKKSYWELDKQKRDELKGALTSAMKQMEESMKGMSEEQKAMIKKHMGGMMPDAAEAAPLVEYKKTGEKAEIAGLSSTRYDMISGGAKEGEIWVAPNSAFQLGAEELAVLEGLGKVFEDFMQSLKPMFGDKLFSAQTIITERSLDGFPVKVTNIEGGKVESETVLDTMSRDKVPAGAFEVDKSYTRQEMEIPKGN